MFFVGINYQIIKSNLFSIIEGEKMDFYVIDSTVELEDTNDNCAYLINTGWDDWFTYSTSYALWIKIMGKKKFIGTTKIGNTQMKKNVDRSPDLPRKFTALDSHFFSLGNDEAFYVELNSQDICEFRESILNSLRDIAFDEKAFQIAKDTNVFSVSLSRDLMIETITGRFRRLANGNQTLSNYHFEYNIGEKQILDFKVTHGNLPPSNIHTIIGRNGVGKSHVLNNMIMSILTDSEDFCFDTSYNDNFFSNILYVNYSTFENKEGFENIKGDKKYNFYHLSTKSTAASSEIYKYTNTSSENIEPKGMDALFIESIIMCLSKKPRRWRECIEILYSDPIFKNLDVMALYNKYTFENNHNEFLRVTHNLFSKLSSGHKIVLLTLTKLVELSEEKTLIIMDEPEMHLHPPLLGSFIRSLSYLLKNVNGVAILATHSPIILQETQRECVYKLSREGNQHFIERPAIETFGENIGQLTSEVFGLEVTDSGFHKILDEVVDKNLNLEQTCQILSNKIGSEAYSILATKILMRDQGSSKEVQVDE